MLDMRNIKYICTIIYNNTNISDALNTDFLVVTPGNITIKQ